MARYLVTGGCGFIGSHLTERLLALGHDVLVLDDLSTGKRENLPAGVRLIEGDVADHPLVDAALAGSDGCFHLAAVASVQKSNEDWLGTHRANLTGTISVLDSARRHGRVPVIYASSAAVYGDNPDLPLVETAQLRPLSAYGADKMGSELHARVASLVHGVPTTGFRFFNVFGPRQDPHSPYSGVISIFINRLLAGQPVTIFGDGLQSRDFIFVSDIVDHLIAAMTKPEPEPRVFNACTGRATTLLDLVTVLGSLIGITPDIQFAAPRTGDIRFSLGDPTLAVARLGVAAKTTLSDGLAATLPPVPKAP
jgi:UDP-glucose 4-epimerase